ncbi:MAG: GCG_CRPN prefix-to-repeats domain-containing protein [Pseudolabrys sp.]
MKKLVAFAFAIGLGVSAAAAQALPLVPDRAATGMIIQVAGGCGIGWHRGPLGGCRRNGWYGGRYWGPARVAGPCFGRGWHRACNGYGRCWRVCN